MIPATEMDGDGQVGWTAVDDRVDQRRVRVRQLIGIVAAFTGAGPQLRIAEVREIVTLGVCVVTDFRNSKSGR